MDSSDLEMANKKLTNILQEGLDNEYISKTEFEAMCTEGKTEGKFCCNFKVHLWNTSMANHRQCGQYVAEIDP